MKSFCCSRLRRVEKWSSAAAIKRVAVLTLSSLLALSCIAGMEEGRQKSQVCAACHGADGDRKSVV